MAAIKHLFHIAAPRQEVYEAITTIEGLRNWWTVETTGNSELGGIITFSFNGASSMDFKVTSLKPNESASWECVAGFPDWVGTTLNFFLDENDGKTRVRFEHAGWKDANDHYAACCFSWGRYMESLRQLCQVGQGKAFGSKAYAS